MLLSCEGYAREHRNSGTEINPKKMHQALDLI